MTKKELIEEISAFQVEGLNVDDKLSLKELEYVLKGCESATLIAFDSELHLVKADVELFDVELHLVKADVEAELEELKAQLADLKDKPVTEHPTVTVFREAEGGVLEKVTFELPFGKFTIPGHGEFTNKQIAAAPDEFAEVISHMAEMNSPVFKEIASKKASKKEVDSFNKQTGGK